MLRGCADQMDLLSEHFYCQQQRDLRAHVRLIPDAVRRKAEAQRRYYREIESLRGKKIPIALDEWNYWYGPEIFGQIGTRYFLRDALGIAAGLNEIARNSDIFYMANYAQTVNVIGAIKTSKTAAAFETTGLVLKLYRKEFGTLPVQTRCSRTIDAQAAWTADRKTLTLSAVNPSLEPFDIPLALAGAKLSGAGVRFEIAGSDPQLHNDPSDPNRVNIVESPVAGIKDKISVGPCSVTLFRLGVE